jgi:hypothetical protein
VGFKGRENTRNGDDKENDRKKKEKRNWLGKKGKI